MPNIIPALVLCDFCGAHFEPARWNQRTCKICVQKGKPDQSAMEAGEYLARLPRRIGPRTRQIAPRTQNRVGHGL